MRLLGFQKIFQSTSPLRLDTIVPLLHLGPYQRDNETQTQNLF